MDKELLDLLGFEAAEGEEPTIESVKTFLGEKYVHVDKVAERKDLIEPLINAQYGKRMKGVELSLMKAAKGAGLEIAHSEIDKLKLEEAQDYIINKFKSQVDALSGSDDEKVKELTLAADRYKKEATDLRELFSTKENDYKEQIEVFKTKEQNSALNLVKSKAFEGVKYKADVKPVTKKGFQSEFDSKYKIAVLEDGSHELRDSNDNRVNDPDNLSKHLTVEKAVELLAKENDLWDSSKHGGDKPPKQTPPANPQQPPSQRPVMERRTNPAFGLGRPS